MKKYEFVIGILGTLLCALILVSLPATAIGQREIKIFSGIQQLTLDVNPKKNSQTKTVVIGNRDLPSVGSYENLKKLLQESENTRTTLYGNVRLGAATQDLVKSAESAEAKDQGGIDYSSTNIQVRGVDEADIMKTDGKYIYQVNNGRVIIVLANPPEKLAITGTLKFRDSKFSPQELYVDENHLVVIGSSYENKPVHQQETSPEVQICPPLQIQSTVRAVIFDISNKDQIKQVREVELEGHYVSSRKIGSNLYLVGNKYLDYYSVLPSYRDSAGTDSFVEIPYKDIRYFPGCIEPNYLLVAGLNLDQPDREMKVSPYLGAGENIYATENNLFIAVTGYQTIEAKPVKDILPKPEPPLSQTTVYKFALKNGEAEYSAKGEVPGTILNQFSMDEHNGYFRIATTKGEIWRTDDHTSKNNIYLLDPKMNITGKIEDIAPGERIYSVRFMGNRAYLVTFKTVDPLFVIDLHDPEKPKILGALKIPGYSDYLHPYDENHIIGFGKDTIELSQKDWEGKSTGTMAFYQGMKIALFDVSDVEHPVQMFQEIIGDRGTDSELLHNHKALLFSREKNLMAFPVTVIEIKNKSSVQDNIPQYGEFAFQGAYVYHLDLKDGFQLKGTITHLNPDDLTKAGYGWYSSNKNVERIIYIGDTLYTLSKGMIKANDLSNLKEISSLTIPQ